MQILLLAGAVLLVISVAFAISRRPCRRGLEMTASEVATIIESFLSGNGGAWDWDEFTSIRIADERLDAVRRRCLEIQKLFPAIDGDGYCSEGGLAELRTLAQELRKGAA